MIWKLLLCSALLAACVQYGQSSSSPKTELQLVTIMFRHGDRAPETAEVDAFPHLYPNETFQPIGFGQLTKQGKLRLYNNGILFRKLYDKFLGDIVYDGNVLSYFTNYPRTGTSVLSFLAGLYPPAKQQQWTVECKSSDIACRLAKKPDIQKLWNPIPYIYNQKITDEMLGYSSQSPEYSAENARVQNSSEVRQKFAKYKPLFQYLTSQTGEHFEEQPQLLFYLVSCMIAESRVGNDLPKWVLPHWDEMQEAVELIYQVMFYSDKQKQLAGGAITRRILNDMVAKANGTLSPSNRKLIIYSGHDITVAPLYASLGGRHGFLDQQGNPAPVNYPSFGTTISIELHKATTTGQHLVKILYHNFKASTPQPLTLVGCKELCPLEQVIALTQSSTTSTG